jgi:hypothetical protein
VSELPRRTYHNADDAAAEEEIAEQFAAACGGRQIKIGVDNPDKLKPSVDRAFIRIDRINLEYRVSAFFEVKRCLMWTLAEAPYWVVSARKTGNLCELNRIVRVPCLFVVRFACGTIVWLDPMQEPHSTVLNWGRRDRGDPLDLETGARFETRQLKTLARMKQGRG